MRQRLGVPQPVLAELFGVSKGTIATAERQIKPLLERAGHTIEPADGPAHHTGRPHRIRNSSGHNAHTKDQTSALIIDKPLA